MPKITLDRKMYKEAALKRMSFSQYLETLDPTPEDSPLDAFERQLKERGIITKTDYGKGINASIVGEAFYRTEDNDILFPEFVNRTVREVLVEDVMLSSLIGIYTTINGASYKTVYADDDPDNQSLKRVTEAARLPKARLRIRDQEVKIYKYGRMIEASYEVIRRMTIDMLALHIRRFGMQAAKDHVSEIIDVVIDGDGNDNAAESYNLTTLDSDAGEGTLTAKGWLKFLMQFEEFPCNTLITDQEGFLQILLTDLGTFTAADVLRLLSQGATTGVSITAPQMPGGSVKLFWHEDVDELKVVGINNQFAIEKVTEAGSEIQEADRFITNQTEVLTISENSGYSKIFSEATKVLDINA